RLFVGDAPNGLAHQRRHGYTTDLETVQNFVKLLDGIGDHQLLQRAVGDAIHRRAGQDAVADVGRNLGGAPVDQRLGRVHQRAARIDDVVEQDAAAPFDVADDVHDLALACLGAALVDDGEVGVQAAGKGAGAHHAADV